MIRAYILNFSCGKGEERSLCIQDTERNIVLLDYLVRVRDNSPIETFGNTWSSRDISRFYTLIIKD